MPYKISQKAFDFMVAQEVTSKAYYIRHYQNPEWPGVQSGPTIAIGYDLGQASRAKIRKDWQGLVPDKMLAVMEGCSGYTGKNGQTKTKAVKNLISIPWETAISVFSTSDLPEWVDGVLKYIPAAATLPPTCLGVLTDLAYNRGHSWNNGGDRYREMRAIKAHVQAGNLKLVPREIESMKRLWDGSGEQKVEGLLRRCDGRIALWNYGLAGEVAPPPLTAPLPQPAVPPLAMPEPAPARTKPPTASAAQATTVATVAAGGAAGAKALHDAGALGGSSAAFIAVGAVALAAVIWYVWHRNRNPK